MKGKSKISNEGKLRTITNRPILNKWLKEISKQKRNEKRRNLGVAKRDEEHNKQKCG